MKFEVEAYTIGFSYLPALINEDYSGLDECKSISVNNFRDRNNLTDDKGHFNFELENEPYFGKCEVSQLYSLVVDIEWCRVIR